MRRQKSRGDFHGKGNVHSNEQREVSPVEGPLGKAVGLVRWQRNTVRNPILHGFSGKKQGNQGIFVGVEMSQKASGSKV